MARNQLRQQGSQSKHSYKERYESYSPFLDQNTLSRKYKVSGIPTLVLLEADTGKVITTDGRSIVAEDPEGANFPWKPKPLSELIGENFISGDKKEVGRKAIEGKILGLYFSAHWVSILLPECVERRVFYPCIELHSTVIPHAFIVTRQN